MKPEPEERPDPARRTKGGFCLFNGNGPDEDDIALLLERFADSLDEDLKGREVSNFALVAQIDEVNAPNLTVVYDVVEE